MKISLFIIIIALAIGGYFYLSGNQDSSSNSKPQPIVKTHTADKTKFSNLFMDKAGEKGITNWSDYRNQRYKQIAQHITENNFNYIWMDSNPIAFTGMPFIVFRAVQELFGKPGNDEASAIFSLSVLDNAGVKNWRNQDEKLIENFYNNEAQQLFFDSKQFNFPVGLNETRILPGPFKAGTNQAPSEAALEIQDFQNGAIRISWNEDALNEENGLAHLKGAVITQFGKDKDGKQVITGHLPMGQVKSTNLRSVTFACGACHIGRVRIKHNGMEGLIPLIGAPNTQFDPQSVGNAFTTIAKSDKFSAATIRKVIENKKPEWFYNPDGNNTLDLADSRIKLRLAQTKMELDFLLRKLTSQEIVGVAIGKVTKQDPTKMTPQQIEGVIKNKKTGPLIKQISESLAGNDWLDVIVFGVKNALLVEQADAAHRLLQTTYSYQKNNLANEAQALAILAGSTPGQVDTLAGPFTAFAKEKGENIEDWEPFMERFISINDFPSIWRQDRREISNWDGTVGAFYRNIGSGLSLGQDPKKLDFRNAMIQKDFIEELPSPAYPFDIDLHLAQKGKQIYQKSCQQCHGTEVKRQASSRDTNLASLNTDPNRSKSITSPMAKFLAQKILEACKDKSLPQCQPRKLGDTEHVVADAEQGYKNDSLGGLWARAPYLHNGSVPTIRHLLQPSLRPNRFCRGSLDYDLSNMGFGWQLNAENKCQGQDHQVIYDTSLPSRKNSGHLGMDYLGVEGDMSDNDTNALIEYLKTF